jgi:hypothetical protein
MSLNLNLFLKSVSILTVVTLSVLMPRVLVVSNAWYNFSLCSYMQSIIILTVVMLSALTPDYTIQPEQPIIQTSVFSYTGNKFIELVIDLDR